MKATQLLKSQHDEVKSLFQQIEKSKDPDEKAALFEELADNLAAHTTIEEKIFYPAVYGGGTEDLLREAVQEHYSAKLLVAELLDMEPQDKGFDAKVRELKQKIEHHVGEEERELFPKVEKAHAAAELEKLAVSLEERFEKEMTGEPREEVREQLDHPAPLP